MPRSHWIIVLCALWLTVSPWILGFSSVNLAVWNNIAVGSAVIIAVLWNFVPPEE